MPPTNSKNMPIGGAATDLGLGDMLGQQVQDETEEQRRKRLAQAQGNPLGNNSAAVNSLLGGMGGYGG